ncbi:hypothetical protein QR98_0017910 [Sarcoptes scabiei]|uniref:Uncharacterized protein n=1 Tax=Sarcoptes scabiei TaxID=52283 RepID=A0A131ZZ14_SARSC|nr:hypothetical protein QR98_0017910 [Sarcoptes scabiei]
MSQQPNYTLPSTMCKMISNENSLAKYLSNTKPKYIKSYSFQYETKYRIIQ